MFTNNPQIRMADEDLANVILAELKRTAAEYTTALTEAQNPQLRHTLQTLLIKTLHDQARLFDWLRSMNLYEAPTPAPIQELQKSVQSKQQAWSKLQQHAQLAMNVRTERTQGNQTSFFT